MAHNTNTKPTTTRSKQQAQTTVKTPEQIAAEERAFQEMKTRYYREHSVREYEELVLRVHQIADQLRDVANRLDREANFDSYEKPTSLVERVQHDVLWMVPNLNLDGLMHHIREIQTARENAK